MTVPTNIYAALERDEGRRSIPYQDTKGNWTCGVGHELNPKVDDLMTVWDDERIDQTLHTDVDNCILQLAQHLPWVHQLDPVREAVFINMCFNLGIANLLKFNETLYLAKSGKWVEASEEMLRSEWSEEVGARARRLSIQLASGDWQ
jgi:lysozyme